MRLESGEEVRSDGEFLRCLIGHRFLLTRRRRGLLCNGVGGRGVDETAHARQRISRSLSSLVAAENPLARFLVETRSPVQQQVGHRDEPQHIDVVIREREVHVQPIVDGVLEQEQRWKRRAAAHFNDVIDAHEVVNVLAGAPVEKVAYEIDTAFPGFVAAFIDGWEKIGGLLFAVCQMGFGYRWVSLGGRFFT